MKWLRSVDEGVGGGVDPVRSYQELAEVSQRGSGFEIDWEALPVGGRAQEYQLRLPRELVIRFLC